MSIGAPTSVPDIYEFDYGFQYISPTDAISNSDSYALFAGGIAEGVPVTVLANVGISAGAAISGRGEAVWQARLYLGAELQHPVLGLFNPTIGIGIGLIGEPATTGMSTRVASPTMLVSLLPG